MPESAIVITDRSLSTAIGAWADARAERGKGYADSLRKVMKTWVFAAYDFLNAAHPPNKAGITAYLMQQTRKVSPGDKKFTRRGAKNSLEMTGTVAAAIIWKLNWKNARSAKNTAAFYQLAKKFMRAREFSSGIHRAGFFATFDLVHGRPGGSSGPRYGKFPVGNATENLLDDAAEIISENFASAKNGIGITGLAGSAFESTLPGVIEIYRRYAMEAELASAQKRGVPLVFA